MEAETSPNAWKLEIYSTLTPLIIQADSVIVGLYLQKEIANVQILSL